MERYEKLKCKHCDMESYFGLVVLWHCWKVHNKKFTKKDLKFILKYGIVGTTFTNIFFIIKVIILLICFPFHEIYESLY